MKNYINTVARVSFFGVVADDIRNIKLEGKYIVGSSGYSTRPVWRYELASLSKLEFMHESRCYYLWKEGQVKF